MQDRPDDPDSAFQAMTEGLLASTEQAESAVSIMQLVKAVHSAALLVGFNPDQAWDFALRLFYRLIGGSPPSA